MERVCKICGNVSIEVTCESNKYTASETLINELVRIKRQKGVSQSELSRQTNVPQKTMSRMENGLSIPTLETLDKIAQALGYTLEIKLLKKNNGILPKPQE